MVARAMSSGWAPILLPGTEDCVLRTDDGGAFRVHRALLCAASPFFRGLLQGGDAEVHVGGVKGSVLNALLAHVYTNQLCVTTQNVMEVMAAADMLLLEDCRDKCMEMLLKNIQLENCLSMVMVSKKYYWRSFRDYLLGYVLEHFDEIWRVSAEFPEMPARELCELLELPELNVRQEQTLLYAIARWSNAVGDLPIVHRPGLRQLLQCVRVGLCKPADLEEFRKLCPALAESLAYREAVLEARERGPCLCSPIPFLLENGHAREPGAPVAEEAAAGVAARLAAELAGAALDDAAAAEADAGAAAAPADVGADVDTEEEDADSGVAEDLPVVKPYCDKCGRNNPERWLPRLPYNMLFVVGGWSMGQPLSAIEAFDPCADRWVHHKNESIFEPRAYHAVAVYKRRIFVVGGMQERNYLRSTISYDMDKCEWKNESSMNVPRAYVAAVTLGEFVYAIGGHTGVERTPSVERYSPRTSQWTVVCRMNRRRSDAAACAIKGRLLVCGGFNGRHCLESIEEYIPQTDTWSLIHSLPFARCSHRMIVLGAYVYVIGGFDGRRRLTSVVRSRTTVPLKWHSVAHLKTPRSTFALAQLDDQLYVIGGYNGKTIVSTVERYSPLDGSWSTAPSLSGPVSAMAACLVSGAAITKKLSVRGTLEVRDAGNVG